MFKKIFREIKFIISKFNVYLRYKNKNSFKYAYKWILFGKDISNFLYEIENTDDIINVCNLVTEIETYRLQRILNEVTFDNDEFKSFFTNEFFSSHGKKNIFGRRLIWYLLARTIKPNLIIESGIDKGLGSSLLCYAQFKNREEKQNDYRYIGVDIAKKNKFYFDKKNNLFSNFEFIYEDSIKFLNKFSEKNKIMYISDAEHNYDFEIKEYNLIKKQFKNGSIIISDNNSGSLNDFSKTNNKKISKFKEKSKNFWYKGATTTISYFY